MEIELKAIKIKDLVNGFSDDEEAGVIGYDGKLDIRPAYQREFRYNTIQQEAVINWKNLSRLGQRAGGGWDTFDDAKLMIFSETFSF